eukprot:9480109-Pyramimonas_sp.AAC.1
MPILRYALLRRADLPTSMLKLLLGACNIEVRSRKKRDLLDALLQHEFGGDKPKEWIDALCEETLQQPAPEELEEAEVDDPVVQCLGMLDEKNSRDFENMAMAVKRKHIKEKHGIKRKRDVFKDEVQAVRKEAIRTTPA